MTQKMTVKICFAFATIFLFTSAISAQKDAVKVLNVFTIVEQTPEYPGGFPAMWAFIKTKLRAPEPKIVGTVYVGFIVDVDGVLIGINIKRGFRKDMNDEALRVIKLMPRWKAGRQGNKAVPVAYTLPIRFE